MSKNRIKVPALTIKTRAEMEAVVGMIASNKIAQQAVTAEMDAAINRIREDYAKTLSRLAEIIDEDIKAARAWADANPGAFGKSKSIDMTHAVIGYRTGQPQLKTRSGWNWNKVLDSLMVWLGGRFVRTKMEPDKEAIIAAREELSVEALAGVGLRVVQQETFYVDPKLTEVQTRETTDAKA